MNVARSLRHVRRHDSSPRNAPLPRRSTRRHLSVQRIAGSLGAEVEDIDLNHISENPGLVREIREAFLEHQVIFFRDQNHLDPESFLNFASQFGKPVKYPFVRGIDGFPEIIQVLKQEHETVNFGGIWHSDTSYFTEPPMGSILLAKEVPPFGGDTLFANQYAAYESLSEGLKRTLSSLKASGTTATALLSPPWRPFILLFGRIQRQAAKPSM
ncbi:hypothetical protein KCU88_g5051, partial [Aureobasidium melanogenum]